eukprot:1164118-Amphidinium_carterae.1
MYFDTISNIRVLQVPSKTFIHAALTVSIVQEALRFYSHLNGSCMLQSSSLHPGWTDTVQVSWIPGNRSTVGDDWVALVPHR